MAGRRRAAAGLLLQTLASATAFVIPLGPAPAGPVSGLALRGNGLLGLRVGPAACPRRLLAAPAGTVSLAAQIKFADAVEEVLVRQWDRKAVSRVVKSWRRMDEDYIHKQFWDEHDTWQVCGPDSYAPHVRARGRKCAGGAAVSSHGDFCLHVLRGG
jgi:hypothetical protein